MRVPGRRVGVVLCVVDRIGNGGNGDEGDVCAQRREDVSFGRCGCYRFRKDSQHEMSPEVARKMIYQSRLAGASVVTVAEGTYMCVVARSLLCIAECRMTRADWQALRWVHSPD